MATKNERVSYIADILKKLGAPSATAIAICCNIRAESGPDFNPQAIEIGSGAPPFIRNGQGYGLFQFSNYPTNHNIYTTCKDMSDKNAVTYQIEELNRQCQPGKGNWFTSEKYPKYNLSWNEFLTNKRNWTVRELTKAFMCEYERPADQTQDRYALYSKEVAAAYDWSKYDKDGGSNAGDGDHESYNFDCGGSRITPPKEPDPKPPDPGGGGGSGIPTEQVEAALKKIEARAKTGRGWVNPYNASIGYQCVALIQSGYFNIGYPKQVTADKRYNDQPPARATAYQYAVSFRDGFSAGRTVAGLSPKKWQWYTGKSFKRGDLIFYKPSAANAQAGHVNVAASSKQAWNQNIRAPFNGSKPQIDKAPINSVGTVFGVLRKTKD